MLNLLCNAAAACALLLGWAITTELGLLTALLYAGLDNSRISRFAEYTLILTIIFGAGLIVLGGVAAGWDVLLAVTERGPK